MSASATVAKASRALKDGIMNQVRNGIGVPPSSLKFRENKVGNRNEFVCTVAREVGAGFCALIRSGEWVLSWCFAAADTLRLEERETDPCVLIAEAGIVGFQRTYGGERTGGAHPVIQIGK